MNDDVQRYLAQFVGPSILLLALGIASALVLWASRS